MNINDLIPLFKDYLEHERKSSGSTVTSYISDLRVMSRVLTQDVEDITLNDMRGYQRQLSRSGLKPATVARKFHGFSTFWKWLRMENYVEENPIERIRLPRKAKRVPNWLSESDLRKFIETPVHHSNPYIQLRNGLAWKTLAWLGVRRSEVLALKVRDVRLDEDLIVIRQAKGNRDRALPLPPELKDDFHQLIANRDVDAYVFAREDGEKWRTQAFTRAFHSHVKKCGLSQPNITPHALRHTFATHLANRDVQVQDLQQLLGHSDIKNTLIYVHTSGDRLRRAMTRHILNKEK